MYWCMIERPKVLIQIFWFDFQVRLSMKIKMSVLKDKTHNVHCWKILSILLLNELTRKSLCTLGVPFKVASKTQYSPLCTYHVTFAKWRVLGFTRHFEWHPQCRFTFCTFQQCISCEIGNLSMMFYSSSHSSSTRDFWRVKHYTEIESSGYLHWWIVHNISQKGWLTLALKPFWLRSSSFSSMRKIVKFWFFLLGWCRQRPFSKNIGSLQFMTDLGINTTRPQYKYLESKLSAIL